MASPQFNKEKSPYRWYSLTYQSNDLLNKEEHNQVKPIIAEILVNEFYAVDIHSYIHGTIIFSINTTDPLTVLGRIIERLQARFDNFTPQIPKLLFSLILVSYGEGTLPRHWMYVDGKDTLELHFKNLISSFYPKR